MADKPVVQVLVWFGVPTSGNFFTLDHSDKGELDQSSYLLGGDTVFELDDLIVEEITFTHGRSRELDEIPAGTGSIRVANPDRDFDPFYDLSPYAGNMVPGRRIRIVVLGPGPIFSGTIADWLFEYDEARISSATILIEDALAGLGRARFDDWTTTSELPGARLNAVLDRPEVAYTGTRDIRAGVETLQADNVSFGSNVLNYMQLVVKSDHGRLYASNGGVVTFFDRSVINSTVGAVFADDGTGIPFARLTYEMASQYLYNRVTVDREAGTAQTVTDSASVDEYGWRSLDISGLLLNTDAQSLSLANYLLNRYKQPEVRVASIDIDLVGLSDEHQEDVLGLENGHLVSVTFTPDGIGDPVTQISFVEGISQTITASTHRATLSLGSAENNTFFILDNATFGQVDAGNQLAF